MYIISNLDIYAGLRGTSLNFQNTNPFLCNIKLYLTSDVCMHVCMYAAALPSCVLKGLGLEIEVTYTHACMHACMTNRFVSVVGYISHIKDSPT